MNGTPINDCNGFFLDSGGNGDYGPNQNFTTTICSDGTNTHIKLVFSGVDMGPGDTLYFYDGTTVNPNTYLSNNYHFPPGAPFIIQATAENTSGCVTIRFVSNGSQQGPGWSAKIECLTACQTILSQVLTTDPPLVPADTGYIDICPGDRVAFSGAGLYPQNGVVYQHSDATSAFEWEFGDGSTAVGPNASHVYTEPGGYKVQLRIRDVKGCYNTNYLGLRIRVAGSPTFDTDELPDQICAGDTIALNSGAVLSNPETFLAGAIVSDSLALPDGTGSTYRDTVFITDFAPGQTFSGASNLESICVNMEHSWMHDLDIFLFCPNGDSIKLQDQEFIGNEVFLGIPYTADDAMNPMVPAPGVGYNYCWTAGAGLFTWTQHTNTFDPQTLPEGDYRPYESFAGLVGCPLNGEWALEVRDLWGEDNGWIFEWSINFAPGLFPDLEVFDPGIADYSLVESPFSIYYDQDSMVAVPTNAGQANFMVTATDGFGCVWDTSMVVPVLPPTHPECRSCEDLIASPQDAVICQNDDVAFNVASPIQAQTNITFEAFPNEPIGFSNHPPANPYYAYINVNSIRPLTLTNPNTQIISVCVNLETDYDSDIRLFLRAPGGQTLELSTGNGGSGDNYTNTCFTPTAATPITAGAAPFTGNFRPEGNWAVFNNANVEGNWALVVSDQFGINELGVLKSWSITFRSTNQVTYTWTPGTGLSCTNCANPVAAPAVTTTYYVNAADSYGCLARDTVLVGVVGDLEAPVVTCDITGDGQLTFWWTQVEAFEQYEVRITQNGVQGAWTGPYTGLSYMVDNLVNNDNVGLEVRVYGGAQPLLCIINSGSSSCIYDRCFLTLSEENITGVTCSGDSDGAASFSAVLNMGALTYFLDGSNDGQPTPDFSNLTGGPHFVVAQDIDGCTDTLDFVVPEPLEVLPVIQVVQEVRCNNGQDGSLTASATGGTGTFTYSWNNGAATANPSIAGLAPGVYNLLVTDTKGCIGQSAVTLNNPEPITLELTGQNPDCFDSNNGAVSAGVNGGTGNFSFAWDNGAVTQNITGLGADDYCVTATDANGCVETACFNIAAPTALEVISFDVVPVDCFDNETGSATVNATGGTGPLDYLWNDPLQQINPEASFLGAGVYTVQITDANGCQITETVEVTQPALLSVSTSVSNVLCNNGSDGSATATPAGGVGPYTFSWTGGHSGPQVGGLVAGNYAVTVFDNNGCTSQNNLTIAQPAEAVSVIATQTFKGCNGFSDNAAEAIAAGGVGNYTYQWNDPGQQGGSQISGLGAQPFTVVATDGNGCPASATVTLEDLPAITVGIIANEPTCNEYSDGRMGVNQVAGGIGNGNTLNYTYSWSNNQSGLTIQGLAGGITYTVTVTDNQGCEGVGSRFLTDPEPVTFETTFTPVSCFGLADGTAAVVNIDGPNNQYSVSWGANAGGQTSITASGLSAGAYNVTVTDDKGCFSSGSVAVTQPAPLTINSKAKDAGCSGERTGFIVLTVEGGVPGYQYQWSTGGSLAQLNDLAAGSYTVTVLDANNCSLVETITITQPEPIRPDLTPEAVTCFGRRDGSIAIQTGGGTPPFRYSLDNNEFKGTSTFIGLPAGNYTVFVKDANNCLSAAQTMVGSPPEFIVDAGEDITIILGDSTQLEAAAIDPAPGFVEYVWSEPYVGTLSCTECANPWAKPMYSIIYELFGIDSKGCEASDLIRVNVEKPRVAMVPTGFTPNEDLTNDLLVVHGMEGTYVKVFRIFDRWGELVYQDSDFYVNDFTRGWDGTFRGQPLNAGVFVWHLEVVYPYDNAEASFKGQTTIIR